MQATQVGVASLSKETRENPHRGSTVVIDIEDEAEQAGVRLVAGKLVPGTRYRLHRWLGEGGMGVVYEAEHVDIERRVALKILRFNLSREPEMAQVFRDEAKAACKMGTPNIVEIYDFGELSDGRLYFAMEPLDGVDLVPETEESWIEPAKLIPLLRQICKGLSAAHEVGVIHRDIKPENVILVAEKKTGREGMVKIVDFGISAMIEAGQHKAGIRRVAGTPHYMAPEQIQRKAFDGRLDMYALGCMAYELLVGRTPFDGETMKEVLHAHVEEEPVAPSKIRPDRKIPSALEAVIMRCIAKDPGDRFADMDELEVAICEAQVAAGIRTEWDDLPLPAIADKERLTKLRRQMPTLDGSARRPRWLWPVIAAVFAVIAISAVTYAYVTREPTTEEQRLVDTLTNEARAAAATNHYVLAPEDDEEATALHKVQLLEELPGAAASLGKERAGVLRREFADTLLALGDRFWEVEGARPFAVEYYLWARIFDPANERARDRSVLSDTDFAVFLHNAETGGFSANERSMIRVASALVDENIARRDARLAAAAAAMNDSLLERLKLTTAGFERATGVALLPQMRPEVEPEPEPEPAPEGDTDTDSAGDTDTDGDTGTTGVDVAPSHSSGGGSGRPKPTKIIKAKRDAERAKELADEGQAALAKGRRDEAQKLFNQALSFDNRNATALIGLSDIAFNTGKLGEALGYAERAVTAKPRSQRYRIHLGDVLFRLNRYAEALEHYEVARDLGHASAEGRIAKVKAKLGGG
ncbi:MAG: protein kinase [Nannocystaceae bacterium]